MHPQGGASEQMQPTTLLVDDDPDPMNVDPTTSPRFSWRLETDHRDNQQAAYRVVVGRDATSVAAGEGDTWDSGRVDSSTATGIRYGGAPLASDETYYWSVKLWTENGDEPAETAWAPPASFSTGLREQDWDGEWIAHQPGVGDSDGWRGKWRAADWAGTEWVQVDLGSEQLVDSVTIHPAAPVTAIRTPDDQIVAENWFADPVQGFGFPNAYRIEVADDPSFEDSTVVASVTDAGPDDASLADTDEQTPQKAEPDSHDELGVRGRYVRVTATDLHTLDPSNQAFASDGRQTEELKPWKCFALAGLSVENEAGAAIATEQPVAASSSVETETWGATHLVNGTPESQIASTSPQLRTDVTLEKPIEDARLHVAAVGYGEAYVNGEQVSAGHLNPAWTDYEERVLYNTYDVADELRKGENTIGLWLGRGWFSKRQSYWASDGAPRARAHMVVTFEDGTTQTVATNESWLATESPITENDIYDGERYDARLADDAWATPGGDTDDWALVEPVDGPGGALAPQRLQAMDVVEEFDVQAVHEHPDGPILDFGQNLTGWLEIEITGADPGDEVTLAHAEALTESGDLSTTDLRTADATDTYVANGDDRETYEPRFTYHGFRYAQVSGYPGEFDPDAVTAKAVHTAMERRGEFSCSDEDLNQVQHNAVWGLRGNTHSIPEDCPQRDERLGWTGDGQISARALLFNFDAVRFQEKWMRDHDDASSKMGYVGDVVPNKTHENPGDPTWTVTRVMIPWYLYQHDGDVDVLREQYEGMRAHLDYWHSVTVDGGILPDEYGKFGDWLAFENTDGRVGLPRDLFNTAYHYQVTATFAKIADVLGNDTDAEVYRERATGIVEAFNDRYFDPATATYGPGTQSAYAVALYMGLVPDEHVEDVVANLVGKVEADGGKLRTGFLGTRPLIHTLADHGHADLAFRVVSQPEQPGWVYMARQGATTMWERWNSDESVGSGMNSLNHSPFTHVSEFFYEVLGGIRVGDEPMTDHVSIEPALVDDLDWVEAELETQNGDLAVSWERTAAGYEMNVTVPWNTTATVRLPDAAEATITESCIDLANAPKETVAGINSHDVDSGDVVFELGSGSYDFNVC